MLQEHQAASGLLHTSAAPCLCVLARHDHLNKEPFTPFCTWKLLTPVSNSSRKTSLSHQIGLMHGRSSPSHCKALDVVMMSFCAITFLYIQNLMWSESAQVLSKWAKLTSWRPKEDVSVSLNQWTNKYLQIIFYLKRNPVWFFSKYNFQITTLAIAIVCVLHI